ncbi:MAG: hypothetical protein EZS28_056221 [Streblomastix strix]|uniref:Uncharacterized protein n=1 Tax=Streblomastix strix TaxID=222440 RepID=A0A5J4PRJ2_9EUKA|nr:MAG: hypothetical protein EZS28_056221 [Streblomastix strix]
MEEKKIVGLVNYSDVCSITNLRQKKGNVDYRLRKPGMLYVEDIRLGGERPIQDRVLLPNRQE